MTKTLTLAIPVYNMERYLGRCLDSVVAASCVSDLEILVINDGSKDGSLDIASQYGQKYPDSVKVIDKPNGGWGSAINLAMELATGKYFKILDSDDWFNTPDFEKLVELLKHTNADLVATSYTCVYDEAEPKSHLFSADRCGSVLNFDEVLPKFDYNSGTPMATLCFRTEILKSLNLKVSDKYYADVEFGLIPYTRVRTILYSQLDVYQYYLGRADHSTSLAGYNAHYVDFVNVAKKALTKTSELEKSPACARMINNNLNSLLAFAYRLLLSPQYRGNDPEATGVLKNLDRFLKAESPELYKSVGQVKIKRVPYIKMWRLTGINILNIKKWI